MITLKELEPFSQYEMVLIEIYSEFEDEENVARHIQEFRDIPAEFKE